MQHVPATVSIALCTYNGSAHLKEQWQSLLEQERLPDELVISDDQSSDGTLALVRELAATAPFPVRILENTARLGSNKNFEHALSACTGDIVFICDQDDFWLPTKISSMTRYMEQHSDVQILFCDAWVTDEHLKGRQRKVWEAVRFFKPIRERWRTGQMLDVMLDGNRVMGCATAIRRAFLPTVLPIPDNLPGDFIYDGWIALVGATYGVIQYIDEPLQLYRTHVRQQVGMRTEKPKERIRLRDRFQRHREKKLAPLLQIQEHIQRIGQLLKDRVASDAPNWPQWQQRLEHFTMRSTLPENRLLRIGPVMSNLQRGDYHRYANPSADWYAPYLAALGDLLE